MEKKYKRAVFVQRSLLGKAIGAYRKGLRCIHERLRVYLLWMGQKSPRYFTKERIGKAWGGCEVEKTERDTGAGDKHKL